MNVMFKVFVVVVVLCWSVVIRQLINSKAVYLLFMFKLYRNTLLKKQYIAYILCSYMEYLLYLNTIFIPSMVFEKCNAIILTSTKNVKEKKSELIWCHRRPLINTLNLFWLSSRNFKNSNKKRMRIFHLNYLNQSHVAYQKLDNYCFRSNP